MIFQSDILIMAIMILIFGGILCIVGYFDSTANKAKFEVRLYKKYNIEKKMPKILKLKVIN